MPTNTINGTSGNDVLIGDFSFDYIYGKGGNDSLFGLTADDSLFGGNGNDRLNGGDGNDLLVGGNGTDTADYANSTGGIYVDLSGLFAKDGMGGIDTLLQIENINGSTQDDEIHTGGTNNTVWGLGGDDTIDIGGGNDRAFGGVGNDGIWLGDGNDSAGGGDGDDQVFGGGGNDSVAGGDGWDYLNGGGGADRMSGGDDLDILIGAEGNDSLSGGGDFDYINGGDGSDKIDGGDDLDVVAAGAGNDYVCLGTGGSIIDLIQLIVDQNQPAPPPAPLPDDNLLETLYPLVDAIGLDIFSLDAANAGTGNDVVEGQQGTDIIDGDQGNDSLFGGSEADIVEGGGGNDLVAGGSASDIVDGGVGSDILIGDDQGGVNVDIFTYGFLANLNLTPDELLFSYLRPVDLENPADRLLNFGTDIVLDFQVGVDLLNLGDVPGWLLMELLDTNGSGDLDSGDDHISFDFISVNNGPSLASTVIDFSGAINDLFQSDLLGPAQRDFSPVAEGQKLIVYGAGSGTLEADSFISFGFYDSFFSS
ncbi:MAG: calcium-binding protein [Geminicoccaceae bacterium]